MQIININIFIYQRSEHDLKNVILCQMKSSFSKTVVKHSKDQKQTDVSHCEVFHFKLRQTDRKKYYLLICSNSNTQASFIKIKKKFVKTLRDTFIEYVDSIRFPNGP